MFPYPFNTFIYIHPKFKITVHNKLFTKAVTTIICTNIRYRKCNSVMILPGYTVRPDFIGITVFFPDQIIGDAKTVLFFFQRRNHLHANRTVGIILIHERYKIRCCTPFCIKGCNRLFFSLCNIDTRFQFFKRVNAVLQLFYPFFHESCLLTISLIMKFVHSQTEASLRDLKTALIGFEERSFGT